MISESCYWKAELLRNAEALRRRTEQRRWPEVALAKTERIVMLGFYSVRKLFESRKITDSARNTRVSATRYKSVGKPVHLMNMSRLDELYALEEGIEHSILLPSLCNQVIHSYIFSVIIYKQGGFAGILVTSDRNKNRELLYIRADAIISALELIGNDNATEGNMTFDDHAGDYHLVLK